MPELGSATENVNGVKGHPEDSALSRGEERAGEQNPYQHSLSPSLDCSHIKSRGPLLAPLVD